MWRGGGICGLGSGRRNRPGPRAGSTVTEGLATIRTALAAHCLVAALCLRCDHIHDLDLEALVERHADTPLIRLPLRCQRCGSRAFRAVVSGRRPAPR